VVGALLVVVSDISLEAFARGSALSVALFNISTDFPLRFFKLSQLILVFRSISSWRCWARASRNWSTAKLAERGRELRFASVGRRRSVDSSGRRHRQI